MHIFISHLSVFIFLSVIYSFLISSIQAINVDRLNKLTKEDLIQLDYDVAKYYQKSYEDLEKNNTSYDEQLYKSIRSIRHTVVIHLFDYFYTDENLMLQSQGQNVDLKKCKEDLEVVYKIGQDHHNNRQIPLGAIDFFESYGHTEAGVLNGNFVWWGSMSSCLRAKISTATRAKYDESKAENNGIKGRYCVTHLRAKTWPQDDKYFGDRISLKVGVCLPESCHSLHFFKDKIVQNQVDYLARGNLLAPYNSERYNISYLYCPPDEDSSYRKWDFGMKSFCVFAILWITILIYASIRHHQRAEVIERLRKSVDIKMIINKSKRGSCDTDNSLSSSELSDEDDRCEEENSEQQVVAAANSEKVTTGTKLDLVKCFALQGNISYLFKLSPSGRSQIYESSSEEAQGKRKAQASKKISIGPPSNVGSRKASVSTEALIKEIQQEQQKRQRQQKQQQKEHDVVDRNSVKRIIKRVDIDLFDGIKVIATNYIVIGHVMMSFFGFSNDIRFGTERMHDLTMLVLINGLQVVSLFYIITGALLTYLIFTKAKSDQIYRPSTWLLIVVGRYIRLIPSYLLIFWFARHVAPNISSGPTWLEYRTDVQDPRGFCATQSWWTMLTIASADVKIPLDCVPQTWYLSNDFRTLFLLPPFIILMAINRTLGYSAIFATIAVSSLKFVTILREANIDYKILVMWPPHVYSILFDRLHDVYTNLMVRLGTYLLGVCLGHLLYLYESKQIKEWPHWFRRYVLKMALLNCGLLFFGVGKLDMFEVKQNLSSSENVDSNLAVILIPFFKCSMEISICIVLLSLLTGGGYKWIKDILTSHIMSICSKISYCVFLVHVEVLYKLPAMKFEANYWYLFTYGLMFVTVSNIVALLIHSLYEMPINNITRHFMRKAISAVGG